MFRDSERGGGRERQTLSSSPPVWKPERCRECVLQTQTEGITTREAPGTDGGRCEATMLKRKNEEDNNDTAKRVALDAEVADAGAPDHDGDVDGEVDTDHPMGEVRHNNKAADDPTYLCLRMLCLAKEAGLVVGKGGEKINHIRAASGTKIKLSDNIKDVAERVIYVSGPSESVARAFGLIVRAIVGEEEDKASGADARPYELRLLVPHNTIGYVIGKQGTRFRQIEENSAAMLSADAEKLPLSTDRCLVIRGVADAIHIATYYVAQTVLECKPLVKGDAVFYDPVKRRFNNNKLPMGIPNNSRLLFNNLMSFGGMSPLGPAMGHPPHFAPFHAGMSPRHPQGEAPGAFIAQMHMGPISLPLDEAKLSNELYIPNEYVGNVIGKLGKNIRLVKEQSGSNVVIGEPEAGSTQRRVTVYGTAYGNQAAIYLINNRINMDRKANEAKARSQQQGTADSQQYEQPDERHETPAADDDTSGAMGAMALE